MQWKPSLIKITLHLNVVWLQFELPLVKITYYYARIVAALLIITLATKRSFGGGVAPPLQANNHLCQQREGISTINKYLALVYLGIPNGLTIWNFEHSLTHQKFT